MKKNSMSAFLSVFGTLSALTAIVSASTLQAYADNDPRTPRPRPSSAPNPGAPAPGGHGGITPVPAPAPAPAPSAAAPAPAPAPSAAPAPIDTGPATRQGTTDGTNAGAREGSERGGPEGNQVGIEQGRHEGFEAAQNELQRAHYDVGYRSGYSDGSSRGAADGRDRGIEQGTAAGRSEGDADGRARSDRDALNNSAQPGRDQGTAQANSSDATARGTADGTAAGDADALAQAKRVDYPRGRRDYYDSRYAEPVSSNDQFSNKPGSSPARVSSLSSTKADVAAPLFILAAGPGGPGHGGPAATPDNRYFSPNPRFGTTEENTAYNTAYRAAYLQGFNEAYGRAFQITYPRAFEQGAMMGRRDAQSRDYSAYDRQGWEEGQRKGYSDNFDVALRAARDAAYRSVFPQASQAAYTATYQGNYDRHFEEARAAAYASRVDQLYRAAFSAAHDAKYAAIYPTYQAQQYARGQSDEAAVFAAQPIRLIDASSIETIENGVNEPGEPLRLKINLRNFGGELKGENVKVVVESVDSTAASVTIPNQTLVKNLRTKSVTSVTDALEFRMNEHADGTVSDMRVSVYFNGAKSGDSVIVKVKTQFQVSVDFAEQLNVKDGLETEAKVRITNVSTKASDGVLNVTFLADGKKLEVKNPTQQTTALGSGESRVLTYTVVAHTSDPNLVTKVALSVTGSAGRRIGLLDQTEQFPVVNDYRVATSDLSTLRTAGVKYVTLTVKNVGSRLVYRGLQLNAKFTGTDNAANFVIIGFNPQYLFPLLQGEQKQAIVPVLVQAPNPGAVLEFEMAEDGRAVVVNRADFRTRTPAPLQ